MVEFSFRQRKNGYAQLVQFFVHDPRMFTQSQSEFRIHVVESQAAVLHRTFHHQVNCAVAQQPDTDIHQEKIVLHQVTQLFYGRLLQHEVQTLRCVA